MTTVDMDVSAVARGQFDSIAGTWKSSDGSRLVFDNTSLVGDITAQDQATVHNYVHTKDDYQEGSGKYDATLSRDNCFIFCCHCLFRQASMASSCSFLRWKQN